MLQVLQVQKEQVPIKVLGSHHVPDQSLCIGFWQAVKLIRQASNKQNTVVFHARRNDEMIQALLLKKLTQGRLKILFTSTAQRYHSQFTRSLMRRMDAVISTCQPAASYLPKAPAAIIPHGVNTQVYCPVPDKQKLAEQLGYSAAPLIGIFGRVRRQKGCDLFLQACVDILPAFPGAQAIVCGAIDDQAMVDEYQGALQTAGLTNRVHILGEQSLAKAQKLMQACNIVTALSDKEGFGLTVLEAMACGCAVVATKAGAWPDIIQSEKNGYLLQERSQTHLNNGIKKLLADPQHCDQLGQNARVDMLSHYRIEQEAAALLEVYQQLACRQS